MPRQGQAPGFFVVGARCYVANSAKGPSGGADGRAASGSQELFGRSNQKWWAGQDPEVATKTGPTGRSIEKTESCKRYADGRGNAAARHPGGRPALSYQVGSRRCQEGHKAHSDGRSSASRPILLERFAGQTTKTTRNFDSPRHGDGVHRFPGSISGSVPRRRRPAGPRADRRSWRLGTTVTSLFRRTALEGKRCCRGSEDQRKVEMGVMFLPDSAKLRPEDGLRRFRVCVPKILREPSPARGFGLHRRHTTASDAKPRRLDDDRT